MNVHNVNRIEADSSPSVRVAHRRRRSVQAVFGLIIAAVALGCGASFSKNDALTDDDIKNARGEAEKRIQAGQRLQILRSKLQAPAAASSDAPAATPPASADAPATAPPASADVPATAPPASAAPASSAPGAPAP